MLPYQAKHKTQKQKPQHLGKSLLFAVKLELSATVIWQKNLVAFFHGDRDDLTIGQCAPALACCYDLAFIVLQR